MSNTKYFSYRVMISACLLAAAFVSVTLAQTNADDAWKEVSTDSSYRIQMPPSNAKLEELADLFIRRHGPKTEVASGIKNRSVVSTFESYLVAYTDFPAPMLDDLDRDVRYFLFTTDHPRTSLTKVYAQKHLGIQAEEVYADSYEITKRIFIVRQRAFFLFATTPILKKLTAEKRAYHQARVEKFFNSFVPLEIPPAKYNPTPLPPKDFRLTLNGGRLKSAEFGLSIVLPPNWNTELHDPNFQYTEAQKADFKYNVGLHWLSRNREDIFLSHPGTKAEYEKKNSSERVYIQLLIERKEFADTTLEKFVNSEVSFLKQWSSGNTKNNLASTSINNVDYKVFEEITQTSQGKTVTKKTYFMEWQGYVLKLYTQYQNEQDKKLVEDSLKTLAIRDE